jgi:hypothetical protein
LFNINHSTTCTSHPSKATTAYTKQATTATRTTATATHTHTQATTASHKQPSIESIYHPTIVPPIKKPQPSILSLELGSEPTCKTMHCIPQLLNVVFSDKHLDDSIVHAQAQSKGKRTGTLLGAHMWLGMCKKGVENLEKKLEIPSMVAVNATSAIVKPCLSSFKPSVACGCVIFICGK